MRTMLTACALAAATTLAACEPAGETTLPRSESLGQSTEAIYALDTAIWDTLNIPVCWENPAAGTDAQRLVVRKAVAATWEAESAVRFTGWTPCAAGASGIRIRIRDEGPHTKGLGSNLDGDAEGMVLNFTFQNWAQDGSCSTDPDECIRHIAVHEFGHALGFAHEQNRPDTPSWCDDEQGSNGNVTVGAWDRHSVMNYCNPEWNGDGELSSTDIVAVRQFYGPPRASERVELDGDGFDDVAFHRPESDWETVPVLFAEGGAGGANGAAGDWDARNEEAPILAHIGDANMRAIPGDFNGDGLTDVAFHHPGSNAPVLGVILARGDGRWEYPRNALLPSFVTETGVIAIAGDFDGDALTDVAFHRPGSTWDTVPVLFAVGDGTWRPTNRAAPSWANQPGAVALPGDYDGDGRTDIAFHRPGSTWETVPVLFARGDGSWTATNRGAMTRVHQSGVIGLPGDYDSDGRTDLAFYRPGSTWDILPVLMADGDGQWRAATFAAPAFAREAGRVAVRGDYDGNGLTDLAFYSAASASFYVALAQGGGRWRYIGTSTPNWVREAGVAPIRGDYDGDGRTDIAFHRPGSAWTAVRVMFAQGDGTWRFTHGVAPAWAQASNVRAVNGYLAR